MKITLTDRIVPLFRCLLLFAATLSFGCGGDSEPPPIRLGHVATLTGSDSDAGKQASLGIRLALMQQEKAKKNKLSRSLAVHHTDTQGDPAAFEAQAIRLASVNDVIALLGGHTIRDVRSFDGAGVPVVSPLGYRVAGFSDHVFCFGLGPQQKGKLVAQFLAKSFAKHDLSIVVDERNPAYLQTAEVLSHAWAESKKTNAVQMWRFADEPNFKDNEERLNSKKESVILFAGELPDFQTFCREWKKRPSPLIFAGHEVSRDRVEAEPVFDGVYWVTAFSRNAEIEETAAFVKNFRKAYDSQPDVHAALAFDGAQFIIEGLRKCEDRYAATELQKQLAKINKLNTVTGYAEFDETHCLRRRGFITRWHDGTWAIQNSMAPEEKE